MNSRPELVDRNDQFVMIQHSLVESGTLAAMGPSAAMVYIVIKYHGQRAGSCFPSHAKLCGETGLSKPTVIAAIKKLIEMGLLCVEQRFDEDNHGKTTNRYIINRIDTPTEESPQVNSSTPHVNIFRGPLPQENEGRGRQECLHKQDKAEQEEAEQEIAAVATKTKSRKADPIYDAIAAAWLQGTGGILTDGEGAVIGKAKTQLLAVGATAEEIALRGRRWYEKYPGATCTPRALVNHWSELATVEQRPPIDFKRRRADEQAEQMRRNRESSLAKIRAEQAYATGGMQ